jgi:hypothetical protein
MVVARVQARALLTAFAITARSIPVRVTTYSQGTLNDPYGFALSAVAIYNEGAIDTGDGNDIITGIIEEAVIPTSYAIYNIQGTIDTGDGNDIITGITPQGMGILALLI